MPDDTPEIKSFLDIYKAAPTAEPSASPDNAPATILEPPKPPAKEVVPTPDEPAPEQVKPVEKPAELPSAPKTPPKEPAKADEDMPDAIKKATKASQESWRTLSKSASEYKSKAADLEQQVKNYESELTKLKTSTVTNPELETLRKENLELHNRLASLDLTQDPKFQEHFNTRYQNAIADLKTNVGDDVAQKAMTVMQMPNGEYKKAAWAQLTENMDDLEKSQLTQSIADINRVTREYQAAVNEARQNPQKYQQAQKEQLDKITAQNKQLLSQFHADPSKHGLEPLMLVDKDEEWNKIATQARTRAETLFLGKNTAEELALAANQAAAYPILREAYAKTLKWGQSLAAQLEKMQKAQPKLDSEGRPDTGAPKEFHDVWEAAKRKAGGD